MYMTVLHQAVDRFFKKNEEDNFFFKQLAVYFEISRRFRIFGTLSTTRKLGSILQAPWVSILVLVQVLPPTVCNKLGELIIIFFM